jgi:hypothetical protein
MNDFHVEPPDKRGLTALGDDETLGEVPPAGRLSPERVKSFEDLRLSQALVYLILRPTQTARQLWRVLSHDPADETRFDPEPSGVSDDDDRPPSPPNDAMPVEIAPADSTPDEITGAEGGGEVESEESHPHAHESTRRLIRLAALIAAVLLALRGGIILHRAATDPVLKAQGDTDGAAFWFIAAALIYLGVETWFSRKWWAERSPRAAAWMRAQFDQNPQWNAALVVPLIVLFVLLISGGGTLYSTIILVLIAVIWLMFLLGRTPPGEDSNHQEHSDEQEKQPGQNGSSPTVNRASPSRRALAWGEAHRVQLALVPLALLFSALAYSLNVARDLASNKVNDVVITPGGFVAWIASIGLWLVVLGGERRLPRVRWGRIGWVIAAGLLFVIVLGAAFRLHDLSSTPPEMTSDHIEKLLDSLRVSEGYRGVFFPNNGGREGFQMYMVALVAGLPGVGFSFEALKLATVIEGVITLPVLWWMARQVIGTDTDERRRLADWTGIALAGLVAISEWHVMLSRLGLRIVLTPLATALVIGFLARAMRHNRTWDYLALGFALGAGTYFYQADRMLPLLALIGIGLALLGRVHDGWQAVSLAGEVIGFAAVALTPLALVALVARASGAGSRLSSFLPLVAMVWFGLVALAARSRRGDALLQYGGGILAAAVIALAVYIPMYHYAEINPDPFWNRTRGRMFGEQAFVRLNPQTGVLESYEPSLSEQARRFWDQRTVFVNNYRDALRMFQWEGDVAWINNPHSYPALDGVAGGLLVLGLMAWGVLLARQRDPVLWLLPVGVLVMLLPSAMTVAYTIENPSFTRASGTIPPVFMLAALPLGMVGAQVARLRLRSVREPVGAVLALVMIASVLWYGIGWNWNEFFSTYRLNYVYSWQPYSKIAQPLHDFAHGEGSYGNAFMIAYPYWLDHRILGTMAGDIRWPNGVVEREDLIPMIRRNRGTPYQYDPDKPLFVMYNVADTETAAYLDSLFPGGEHRLYQYRYEALEPGYYEQGAFYIFTVQAGNTPLE